MLQGIIKRDEMVFSIVRGKRIPIVMLTSGGYQRRTAEIIARSILNLRDKRLIENSPSTQWHVSATHGGWKNSNYISVCIALFCTCEFFLAILRWTTKFN